MRQKIFAFIFSISPEQQGDKAEEGAVSVQIGEVANEDSNGLEAEKQQQTVQFGRSLALLEVQLELRFAQKCLLHRTVDLEKIDPNTICERSPPRRNQKIFFGAD